LSREEWRRSGVPMRPVAWGGCRQGKKTSRPLRMPIEPSFRSAVFGQTCPIETAVGEPTGKRTRIRQMASSGGHRLETPNPTLQHAHHLTNARLYRSLRRAAGWDRGVSRRVVELPHDSDGLVYMAASFQHALAQLTSIVQPVSSSKIKTRFPGATQRFDIDDVVEWRSAGTGLDRSQWPSQAGMSDIRKAPRQSSRPESYQRSSSESGRFNKSPGCRQMPAPIARAQAARCCAVGCRSWR
jgi:hypothetical protein